MLHCHLSPPSQQKKNISDYRSNLVVLSCSSGNEITLQRAIFPNLCASLYYILGKYHATAFVLVYWTFAWHCITAVFIGKGSSHTIQVAESNVKNMEEEDQPTVSDDQV